MEFIFRKLKQENALIIANDWKYDGEYAFYDMTADEEDYNEFINELTRENNYYEAILNNELIGFFCITEENNDIEIGLGLKPDICGKGLGKSFLLSILEFIKKREINKRLIMSVATFNKRAIKVYEECGFVKEDTFIQKTNGGEYEFIHMTKSEK